MRGTLRAAVRPALAGVLAAGAVLLALGGPARSDERGIGGGRAVTATTAPRGDVAAGRALFVRMGCGSCHRLAAGAGIGPIGPDLDVVLPSYSAAMLRAKIADPYPAGTGGSFIEMPAFGSRMSAGELDQLVSFLLSTTRN